MRTLVGETALPAGELNRRGVGPVITVAELLQIIQALLSLLALVVGIIAIAIRD